MSMRARGVEERRMSVYVCGPVTGYSDLNRPLFEAAAEQLSEAGMDPVVPHDFVPWDAAREEAMRLCLCVLCAGGIDALAVLPGFSDSDGSCLEIAVAEAVGVSVYPIDALLLGASEPTIPLDSVPENADSPVESMGRNADGGNRKNSFHDLLNNWRDEAISQIRKCADPMNNGYMENGGRCLGGLRRIVHL